jgi:hypothetical protein
MVPLSGYKPLQERYRRPLLSPGRTDGRL